MRTNIIIALLGLIAGLFIASMLGNGDAAFAQSSSGNEMVAFSVNNQSTQRDMIAVVDIRNRCLLLYDYKDSNKLSMVAARNISYDTKIKGEFISTGRHLSPADIKKEIDK
ncbi:MAG: hypothetical protein ABIH42_11175, partial [Planctomycetota bacterium]